MKRNVEIKLTAEDLANELWENCDCVEQAEYLYEIARLYKFNREDFLRQLQAVTDEINSAFDEDGKYLIVRCLEQILSHIKGD